MLYLLIFGFYVSQSQVEFTCDRKECPNHWINDAYCDKSCMVQECNYDSAYYHENKYLVFTQSDCFTECDCDEEMLTNGKCDPECDSYNCGYDLGDCGQCSSGCFLEDLKSITCKDECYNDECRYNDLNPCFAVCASGCYLKQDLFSDYCFEECLAESCLTYENSTCNLIECAPGCSIKNDLFSDTCKMECFTPDCLFYENATCRYLECAPKCTFEKQGDYICQSECYNPICNYDNADCNCHQDCFNKSGECLTNETYSDPCDDVNCNFKDGKCGFCSSGCFEPMLGDGICQDKCNTKDCNYDKGDCGCAHFCQKIYNDSNSYSSELENISPCSTFCLVSDCHFGIDFCPDKMLIKQLLINYMVKKGDESFIDLVCSKSICSNENFYKYLNGVGSCSEDDDCNNEYCSYCFGQANKTFPNCLRQSFNECILCNSSIIERFCYEGLVECPHGYKNIQELADMFGNPLWCLKEIGKFSKSNYKEIFVDSSAANIGDGEKETPVKTLYRALVNVYADYTKIYLVNKEIDFFVDGSISVLVSDIYDPLNIHTSYSFYELWIIGNFSDTEKTIVYWKDNLKISPLAEKFYIKNIEFNGKYVLKKQCSDEYCFYCPYVTSIDDSYFDDSLKIIDVRLYQDGYAKNCSSFSSVTVFNFSQKAYIENVVFSHFRYQFSSFIRSYGQLSLKNVNFYKMQSKSTGSIVLVKCNDNCFDSLNSATTPEVELGCSFNCLESTFIYDQGLVTDIGAGYNDVEYVKTGSFLFISGIGYSLIKNVIFSYNFAFNNLRSSIKGYLIYSKEFLGTLTVIDCEFSNNYVNYLVYVDVSSIVYKKHRLNGVTSIDHTQQHFYMNNIIIKDTYCSKGVIYYLMENLAHNINITNISLKKMVVGDDGIFTFMNNGKLKESDINGDYYMADTQIGIIQIENIFLPPKFLKLENITIQESLAGKHAIYIKNYPNSVLRNIQIEFVRDIDIDEDLLELDDIIKLIRKNDSTRHFYFVDKKTKNLK